MSPPIAIALPAGVARAQAPSNPLAAGPAETEPQQPNYPASSPITPAPHQQAPGQQRPAAQRPRDPELRFRRRPTRPRRRHPQAGTMVEAASSGVGASKVQVETARPAPPARGVAEPGRAAGPALATTASTSSSWSTTSSTRSRASSAREDPNLMSPMAIRLVRLSANLRPEFARTLEARLIARLLNATNVKIDDLRRVHVAALARRERQLGPDAGRRQRRTTCAARREDRASRRSWTSTSPTAPTRTSSGWRPIVFRASDGGVVWSDAYRSDGTMAALLRTGQRIPTRAERAAELEQKIAGRPNYGYALRSGSRRSATRRPPATSSGAQRVAAVSRKVRREPSPACSGSPPAIFTTGAAQHRTSSRRR